VLGCGRNADRADRYAETDLRSDQRGTGLNPCAAWYKEVVVLRNRYVLLAVALAAAFLAGFLPQYFRTRALQTELAEATQENGRMRLRDLAALAYLQAGQKNFGLAAQTASGFFDSVQQMAAQDGTTERKKMYDEIYSYRDKVTAALAKGDPGVIDDLQNVYLKTRAVTAP
jgi:hypothetical protein